MIILMVVRRIFNITTGGMGGICPGTGITPPHSAVILLLTLTVLKDGLRGEADLIETILSSKNSFARIRGHIRHHPHLPCQGNFLSGK